MPKKVSVKSILELCTHVFSMNKIEAVIHASRHTISTIYKAVIIIRFSGTM